MSDSDNEEDLLTHVLDAAARRTGPAARVVRASPSAPSGLARASEALRASSQQPSSEKKTAPEAAPAPETAPVIMQAEVIEKKGTRGPASNPPNQQSSSSSTSRPKSLFAQQFDAAKSGAHPIPKAAMSSTGFPEPPKVAPASRTRVSFKASPTTDPISSMDVEQRQIHVENLEKISRMPN
jgi:hypothetical protein